MIQSRTVDTRTIQIHYLEAGRGEPLLLLHGWPQTSHCWLKVIPALAEHFHVIAPDLRGFGQSGKSGLPLSRAVLAADIAALLDALQIDTVRIAGHDWGGMAALKFAFDFPHRVRQLALIDCSTTHWPHWAAHGLWAKVPGWAEDYFARCHDTFIRWCFTGEHASYPGDIIAPFPPQAMPGLNWCDADSLTHYRNNLADPAVQAASVSLYRDALPFYRQQPDGQWHLLTPEACRQIWQHPGGPFAHPDYRDALCFAPEDLNKTVQCPALYVYTPMMVPKGFRDGVALAGYTPEGNTFTDSLARPFSDLRCAGIPCGHFIPEEQPQQLATLLESFFLNL